MMRLLALGLLALSLSGCANVSKVYDAVTGATVSPAAVIVAGNSFDALEVTATNYLTFCKANKALAACSNYVAVRKAILPAVRSGRVARNNLENFLQQNPGKLGPSGLYNALIASINTVQAVINTYQIGSVGAAR